MNRSLLYLLFLSLIALVACTKEVGKTKFGNYPDDIGAIIGTTCSVAGCHNSKSYQAAGSFNMETWQSMFAGSSNGSPVIPYNSQFSSLCYFINTYADLGIQNVPRMPLNMPALSHDEVKRVQDWISRGAPDAGGNVWASNPALKKLYAVNQGCDVVTVFDSESKLPMRMISVGTKAGPDTPHQIRVSPDGQFWYVIFINNNIMQKFRCSDDNHVSDIPLTPMAAGTGTADAQDWNTMVISGDSKRAYCVSWTTSGKITAIDLEHEKLLHFLGGQYFPHGISLNAAEDRIFVASQTGNFISEIDTGFTIDNRHSLQNGLPPNEASSLDPHYMILTPDKNSLVITCQKSNELRVFDLNSYSVTAVIQTGVYPQEVVYSKAGNRYFVSCTEDSTTFPGSHGVVTCVDAGSYSPTHIRCGFQPHGLAVDDYQNVLYVLSRNISVNGPLPHHTTTCAGKNGFVNFIDVNTLAVLKTQYELSVDPYYIYPRP